MWLLSRCTCELLWGLPASEDLWPQRNPSRTRVWPRIFDLVKVQWKQSVCLKAVAFFSRKLSFPVRFPTCAAEKPVYALIYYKFLEHTSKVFMHGATAYFEENLCCIADYIAKCNYFFQSIHNKISAFFAYRYILVIRVYIPIFIHAKHDVTRPDVFRPSPTWGIYCRSVFCIVKN